MTLPFSQTGASGNGKLTQLAMYARIAGYLTQVEEKEIMNRPLTDTDLHNNRIALLARRSMDGKAYALYCRKESRMERLRIVSAWAGLALIAAVALYAVCALMR